MEPKRILVVDDNESIHHDFHKALEINKKNREFENIRNKIFPNSTHLHSIHETFPSFIIDSAYQGLEAVELLQKNMTLHTRYSLAFIDMLMPPGIDGVATIEQLWTIDPDLQVVICTAHSDYPYEKIYDRLKGSDNFLILKKPFDIIEILQLSSSLTRKWELSQQARLQLRRQQAELDYFFKEADFLYRLSQLSQLEFSTQEALIFYVNEICALRNWPIGHIYQVKTTENDNQECLYSTHIWYLRDNFRFKKYQELVSNMQFGPGVGLPGWVLKFKKPYWIENILQESQFPELQMLADSHINGALVVPIKICEKVTAVVEFFSEEPMHRDQQLLDLTIASANQLGLLLARHRNEKELKANYKQLQSLYEEMRNTQAQLVQQAKLASIGQLAAGIAHEINNPLAYIMSNTEVLHQYIKDIKTIFNEISHYFLQLNLKDQKYWGHLSEQSKLTFIIHDSEEILKESLEGLERVREIISDLRSFSRMDEAEIQKADINHCIDLTLKMIWNEIKYRCTVIKEYEELPPLPCYAKQLNQVFMNLLINASQAIVHIPGQIKIITQCFGEAIHIIIQDNGEGIPVENIGKLFDPFFTTKPIGTGTGLGLSISYNIIKKHSGTLHIESEGAGKGTTCMITLPLAGIKIT